MDQLIIGIDAGGTKTSAWLAVYQNCPASDFDSQPVTESIRILGRGTAGPGNLRAVGFEIATGNMEAAIYEAYRDADLEFTPAAAACLGVAGAGRPLERSQLWQWCHDRHLATQNRIVGDATPVLAAACGQQSLQQLRLLSGLALISGTGSLAWGCKPADKNGDLIEARVGGWGYLLGDEGSAYWIALEGLRAVCRASDGIGPETELLPALLEALHLESPQELIGVIYGGKLDRQQIAQLAPIVLRVAGQMELHGDQIAQQIVERAVLDLTQMVECMLGKLKLADSPCPLALAGGVLQHGTQLREKLLVKLSAYQLQIHVVEAPVLGSVYLAAAELSK